MNKVSVAFIGMGYRGKQLFRLLRNIPFFQILAVADPGVEPSELPDISCYNHGEASSGVGVHCFSLAISCAARLAMCGAWMSCGFGG